MKLIARCSQRTREVSGAGGRRADRPSTDGFRTRAASSRYLSRRGFFFFQAEDGIRDVAVTGVQTCALPISSSRRWPSVPPAAGDDPRSVRRLFVFSTHTQAGEPAKRGLVFPSADRDQALAKALAPALQSASCQGERLTSSRL